MISTDKEQLNQPQPTSVHYRDFDGSNVKHDFIEPYFNCIAIVEFRIGSRRVGALLLEASGNESQRHQLDILGRKIGHSGNRVKPGTLRLQFLFISSGIHANMRPNEVDPVFDCLTNGFQAILENETLGIHMGSFVDQIAQQEALTKIGEGTNNPILRYVLASKKAKINQLHKSGFRNKKFLNLWTSFTEGLQESDDRVAKFTNFFVKLFDKATGQDDVFETGRLLDFLADGYDQGFNRWEQLLDSTFGLNVVPATAEEIWEALWLRFNRFTHPTPPPIPQMLIFNGENLDDVSCINSPVDIRTVLMQHDSAQLVPHGWFVDIDNHYVAAMPVLSKPSGFLNKSKELRYYWDVLRDDSVFDTEIFTEVSTTSQKDFIKNMQRLTRSSRANQRMMEDNNDISVAGGLDEDEALRIQARVYGNDRVVQYGSVFLVHRPKDHLQLDRAVQLLQSKFGGAEITRREDRITWITWLGTLPITWEPLLTEPWPRRLKMHSEDMCAFTPLVTIQSVNQKGYEFYAKEGGTPLYIDIIRTFQCILFFSTTRAGKSVTLMDILAQALAEGAGVSIVDYPLDDRVSTFEDFTKLTCGDGAYQDVVKSSNNIFDLPNLSLFDDEKASQREQDYRGYIKDILQTMIMGVDHQGSNQPVHETIVSGILTFALDKFFKDAAIFDRYEKAIKGGIGSLAWERHPVLEDLVRFCTVERLGGDRYNPGDIRYVRDQLTTWTTGRYANALNKPSTVNCEQPLFTMALRGIKNQVDAAVFAQIAILTNLRRSYIFKVPILFFDEISLLCKLPPVSRMIGTICANGAKSGYRIILSGQQPLDVFNSAGGEDIKANYTEIFVGSINPGTEESYVKCFGFDKKIIDFNASEAFHPNFQIGYSHWLRFDKRRFTYTQFYPSPLLIALTANNIHEIEERRRIFALFPDADEAIRHLMKRKESRLIAGDQLPPGQSPASSQVESAL
jgi:hypothetical protein